MTFELLCATIIALLFGTMICFGGHQQVGTRNPPAAPSESPYRRGQLIETARGPVG